MTSQGAPNIRVCQRAPEMSTNSARQLVALARSGKTFNGFEERQEAKQRLLAEHKGEKGTAYWRTCQCGSILVRMIEYTPGYLADHWCSKGHILLCLEGELHTELRDGRQFLLKPGMSYQVADDAEPHRSYSPTGAKLFIVD
jgi:hypothetical protein